MNQIARCQPLLGTFVEVSLKADESRQFLLDISQQVYAEINRIHHMMSFHHHDSELTYINQNAFQKACNLSPEMEAVLTLALELSQKTDGLFDVSVAPKLVKRGLLPAYQIALDETGNWQDIVINNGNVHFKKRLQLDLGGIAKGYAVDCGLSKVPKNVRGIINAGGDMRMTHWQEETVEIRNPENHQESFYSMDMLSPAVATSAGYYHDDGVAAIMHPSQPSESALPLSGTVFANNAMLADALTKVVFLKQSCASILDEFSAKAFYISQAGEQIWVNR